MATALKEVTMPSVSELNKEVESINGIAPIDENGVDLSLIEFCLRMTPAERLRTVQAAANAVYELRRLNGLSGDPWKTRAISTGSDYSEG
jgi:hypothetical protein